jgi:aspartyl-tRNA(Asn)/glutamyl-tRNA(Gln) amidotransferase subunit C
MNQDVNADLTRKIAHLARLKLSENEVEQYTKELGKILDFVAQLNEVNTQGVEPSIHGIPLDPHFREDIPVPLSEEETKRIVACAEQTMYDQFRVPQVIGGES